MEREPVLFGEARRRAGDEILPYARLDSWIRWGLVHSPPDRAPDGQRIVDWKDVDRLLDEVKEAVRIGRSSVKPFKEKDGTRWLPLVGDEGVLTRRNGFDFERETVQGWHSQRNCPHIGRRIGKLFYAKTPTGKWRRVLFIKEKNVEAIEKAVAEPKPEKAAKASPAGEVPGPEWIELDETMRLTKAKSPATVINARTIVGDRRPAGEKKSGRKKRGFKCGTKLLPLRAKVFMRPQTMTLKKSRRTVTRLRPHVLYNKADAEAIGAEDWQYETRADDFYINPLDPKDEHGKPKRYLYVSTVGKNYRWRDTTLTKWRNFCPALGGPIEFLEVESRYSNRETEYVYLESNLERIRGAIGTVNWKRKAKGKLKNRARGERGRLLPLEPVRSKEPVGSNGDGQAAGKLPARPPKKERGRPKGSKTALKERYTNILERWDKASAAGVLRKEFPTVHKDVSEDELKRAIIWRSAQRRRQHA